MALLRYLQHKDRSADPKGSLSSEVPAAAIAHVNQEVQAASSLLQHTYVPVLSISCFSFSRLPDVKAAKAEIPCVILHFLNIILHNVYKFLW